MTATTNEMSSPVETEAPVKPKINPWAVLAVLLVLGLLALLGWGLVNTNRVRPIEGSPAPEFTVQYYDGYDWQGKDSSTLSDYEGHVVVLNFWASWCVECRYEADLLEQTWQDYRDDGVIFLGVAYVDVEPKSREYLTEFNVSYPNAPDLRSLISRTYEITGVPETFIIDQQGEIAYVHIGPIDAPTLSSRINELLSE